MTRISALTGLASADAGDTLPILDVSATTTKKITKTALLSDVVDGTLLADDAIQSRHIDWANTGGGNNGGIWWEELGRTTLGSAGDTISVASFLARKYLRVIVNWYPTGGNIIAGVRFNNDSGNNYAFERCVQFNTITNSVSQSAITFIPSANTWRGSMTFDIDNVATQVKRLTGQGIHSAADSAATLIGHQQIGGKWANTSDQITRVDIINTSTGDFAIGSELIVLGHD